MDILEMQKNCRIPDDPDLTGPGIRLALMIPAAEVVLLSVSWTLLRGKLDLKLLPKLVTALCHLNALQLTTAIIFLAIAWSKRDVSDWFHIQFALHISAVSVWSTSLAAIVIPGWFTKKMFQLPALVGFFVLFVLNLRSLEIQISRARVAHPHCFAQHPYIIQPVGMWVAFAFVVFLFGFIATVNGNPSSNPNSMLSRLSFPSWKSHFILLLELVPILGIIAGFYVNFAAYSDQKHFLMKSEDTWTTGQIIPLCFVIVGSVADLWNVFDLDVVVSDFARSAVVFMRDKIVLIATSIASLATSGFDKSRQRIRGLNRTGTSESTLPLHQAKLRHRDS